MAKKNRAVLGILLLVFFFFVILMTFAVYVVDVFNAQTSQFQTGGKSGQIGVVEVKGVIMEAKPTIELLHKAENDPNVKAILVRINSPGGAVGPTQEIYEEMRRIDTAWSKSQKEEKSEKAEEKKGTSFTQPKPVYASFGTVAASGGYYLGSAARKIYSNPGTLTGSIGVIMQFMDLSELFALARIEQTNIKAGKYKDIGSPSREMTREEKELLDEMVKGVHKQFIQDIVKTRKKRLKRDIQELAQGQIFSGKEAHKFGLVDELKGMWAAGRDIHRRLGLEGEFGLKFIEKEKPRSLFRILDNIDKVVNDISQRVEYTDVPALMFTP